MNLEQLAAQRHLQRASFDFDVADLGVDPQNQAGDFQTGSSVPDAAGESHGPGWIHCRASARTVDSTSITRLAPSPTGVLHLGNARTFLLNWLWARASGARLWMRVEDIDGPRIKAGAEARALEDLRWMGLDIFFSSM